MTRRDASEGAVTYLLDPDDELYETFETDYPNHGLAGGTLRVTLGRIAYAYGGYGPWHRMGTIERLSCRELGELQRF